MSSNPLAKWEVLDIDITVMAPVGQGGQASVFRGEYGTASEPVALKDLYLGADVTPEYFQAFAMETQVGMFTHTLCYTLSTVLIHHTLYLSCTFVVHCTPCILPTVHRALYQVLSVINHPHIVKFYGICYKSRTQQLFMVSELCDGTLRDLLYAAEDEDSKPEPLSADSAERSSTESAFSTTSMDHHVLEDRSCVLHICRAICSAMIYLEHKHVVHSDLKPANVLYNRTPGLKEAVEIRLCDFGMSRTRRGTDCDDRSSQSSATSRKSFGERRMTGGASSAFTPYYAAPEVRAATLLAQCMCVCGVLLLSSAAPASSTLDMTVIHPAGLLIHKHTFVGTCR
jgi:serine/threonine protein kinase